MRMLDDFEGLALVTIKKATAKNRKAAARARPKKAEGPAEPGPASM
jgi:hypothetical protein